MANDDHVYRLRQGVDAWNAWRRENPDLEPDLRGGPSAVSTYRRLTRLVLTCAMLTSAARRCGARRLVRARFDGANLFKTVLDDADVDSAVLTGARFLNCAQPAVARNWQ